MVSSFDIPILINAFNRPHSVEVLLTALREIKPSILYIHCDGPRKEFKADVEKVFAVRRILDTQIDWPCSVNRLYEEINLGCGRGPAAAISWFFAQVELGIILEDDCIPNKDFFCYCSELLDRYRDDERIGIISGTCFIADKINDIYSYRFSSYAGIWGWATWRRTWDLFDFNFNMSDHVFKNKVAPFLKSRQATDYWINILRKCREDVVDKSYWDYQFHLSLMFANKIHIVPNRNLVSNIGFNDEATHTLSPSSKYANAKTLPILPLIHPEVIAVDHKKDNQPYVVPAVVAMKRLINKAIGQFRKK